MSVRASLAFYAPLKSPRHPVPSGDRTMAILLMRALEGAGFAVELASESRSFEPAGDAAEQERIRDGGIAEADAIAQWLLACPRHLRPAIWFTYHCYYKAPDWIGPRVAAALAIPYVVAEGSRAGKRAGGAWDLAHRGAEAALDQAAILFAITGRDREALERRRRPDQAIVALPPFLDANPFQGAGRRGGALRSGSGPVRLVTVAMMREGDKLASFRLLAAALHHLDRKETNCWRLDIVGDGPARAVVEKLFAPFGLRVTFAGRIDEPSRLAAVYGRSDLFVWPAVNEAFGMAPLEAQASGCPVLAGRQGGIEAVVQDGVTGLLTPAAEDATFVRAFAADLAGLIADRARLAGMGVAARAFVAAERDLPQTAGLLAASLLPLIGQAVAA